MATSVAMYMIIAIAGTVLALQSLYEALAVVVFLLAEENRRRLQRTTFQVHVWIPEDFRHRCGMECSLLSLDVTVATTLEQVIEECRTRLHTLPPLDLHITEKHDVHHRKFGDATTIGDLRLEEGSVVYLRATPPNGRGVLGAGTGAVKSGGNGRRGPDKQPRKRSCRKKTQPPASKVHENLRPTADDSRAETNADPNASLLNPDDDFVGQYIHGVLKVLKLQLEKETGDIVDRLKAGHMWITAPNPVVACHRRGLRPDHFYKPDIFCWLPKLYFPELQLRCPHCGTTGFHVKNGYASNPEVRRVRGLRNMFYVFTNVLKCEQCRSSFYATHPDVIAHMPMAFNNELVLPFVLTESCGLDAAVVWLMPSLFNDGTTPESLSRTIDEAYKERRDLLHATYNALCDYYSPKDGSIALGYKTPAQFDPNIIDVNAPSAAHLASVFRRQTLLQKSYITVDALRRSASSLAYDFSHKVPRMMAKLAGNRMFDSLFQATNEFSEIVMFFFCVGTGFDQVAVSRTLCEMLPVNLMLCIQVKPGIKQWLHVRDLLGQPKPNVVFTDKCCEDQSLIKECFPYFADHESVPRAAHPTLTLPRRARVISHEEPANAVASTWMDKAQQSRRPFAAGVDCEWTSSAGQRTKVATLQVAVEGEDTVYIFHLSQMRKRPRMLKRFLECPTVIKAGRSIGIDKKYLAEDYQLVVESHDEALSNSWVELAAMATRLEAAPPRSSLAKLVENVLARNLPKPQHIRCSQWTADKLSDDQVEYAALDAYAGLMVYLRLAAKPDPSVRLAAMDSPQAEAGAPTPLPGMPVELLAGHTVAAMGKISTCHMQFWEKTKVTKSRIVIVVEKLSSASLNPISQIKEILPQTEVALPPTAIVVIVSKFNRCRLCATLITFTVPEKRYDEPVRCCLQDVFHLMKRIKVKKAHPFYSPYVIALSDAFFIWDSSDLNKVADSLRKRGEDPVHWKIFRRDYFLRRVRRRIPVPSVLRARILAVCDYFSKLLDHNGVPLFDEKCHKDLENLLEHIDKGCCSDPDGEGYPFYQEIGVDKDGLVIYRCSRGTNCCESNHRVLKKKFGSMNAGIALTEALMLQHVLRTNIRAAEKNRPGHYIIGHFKPWLVDLINFFGKRVWGTEPRPEVPSSLDWQWDKLLPHSSLFHFGGQIEQAKRGSPHRALSGDKKYLAFCQGARLPYLPLHTEQEKQLYVSVLSNYVRNHGGSSIDFDMLADTWNYTVLQVWDHYDSSAATDKSDREQGRIDQSSTLHETDCDRDWAHPNVFMKFAVHMKRYHDELAGKVDDRHIRRGSAEQTRALMNILWVDCTANMSNDRQRHGAAVPEISLEHLGPESSCHDISVDQPASITASLPAQPEQVTDPTIGLPDDCDVTTNPAGVDPDAESNLPRVSVLPGLALLPSPALDQREVVAGETRKRRRAKVSADQRRCRSVKQWYRTDEADDDEDLLCGKMGCPGVHNRRHCANDDPSSWITRKSDKALRYLKDTETRAKRKQLL
ncbi:hypothetical protein PBRA_008413 [Plasmodiophora brassicae]|uniref:3'-5' exonuclease n=1 Tax=Plasmodiophora brassicae TaxID=37360 RepID=A0A0G4J1F9_PLABS|nr:hypothetical protein PBRA_008413 [Plasmodiophora brassicae]